MWVKIEFRLIGGKRNWHCKCRVRPQSAVTAIYSFGACKRWYAYGVFEHAQNDLYFFVLKLLSRRTRANIYQSTSIHFENRPKRKTIINKTRFVYYNLAAVYIIIWLTLSTRREHLRTRVRSGLVYSRKSQHHIIDLFSTF